jgi:hypothetical protein
MEAFQLGDAELGEIDTRTETGKAGQRRIFKAMTILRWIFIGVCKTES